MSKKVWLLIPVPIVYYCTVCPSPELKEAVEDVLPSLTEHGVTILLMTKHCDTPGIDSFSDKVEEAPDTPLPRSLRSHLTFKSPAVYIYTSGTTGMVGGILFPFSVGGGGWGEGSYQPFSFSCVSSSTFMTYCLGLVVFQVFPRLLWSIRTAF